MTRLEQQMEFIMEVDKLKKIERQTYLSDASRKENDAEHSWHLALMAILLSEHSNKHIDVLKTITMVLIHDIVEIDAGDTFAYDIKGNQTKREREEKAADRIFNLLPKDQAIYMREIWEEFERADTNEAKFAHTLDNLQPLSLNNITNGKSWREHKIKATSVRERQKNNQLGSVTINEYVNKLIEKNIKNNNIINE